MSFLQKEITRYHTAVVFENDISFLQSLPKGIGHEPFCLALGRVLDSTTLSNTDKVDQLMDIVHQNAGLLVDKMVARWLSLCKDEKLAQIIWDSFVGMPPSTNLSKVILATSQEAWVIKQMIAVIKGVGTPEELSAFAVLTLEKYPNIYGYDLKNKTLVGLAKYLRDLAGNNTPRRFLDLINTQQAKIFESKPIAAVEKPAETKGEKVNIVLQLAEQTEAERSARDSNKPGKTNNVVKVVRKGKPDNGIRGLDTLNGLSINGVTLVVP